MDYVFCVNALCLTGNNHCRISGGLDVKLIKFAILCSISLIPLIMIPFIIQRWLFPCNLALLFFFIIPACSKPSTEWTTTSIITLFGICMVILYCRYDSIETWIIFYVDFSLVQVFCLRCYLDWTVEKITVYPNRALNYFKYYRQIQILSRYYNLIQQDILVAANLGLTTVAFIISVYVLLTIGLQSISNAELVLFLTSAHDAVVVLLLYTTFMSKLFETSKGFVGKIKLVVLSRKALEPKKRKLIEKNMRSFKPMKSYLGYANFVDKSTPFVMLDFCITQIVNLLLIK